MSDLEWVDEGGRMHKHCEICGDCTVCGPCYCEITEESRNK